MDLFVEETFFRQMRHHEFDVSEISFSSYLVSMFQEQPPFVGIPIFPSRSFRHSGIYVNSAAGIRTPKDLIGRKIGDILGYYGVPRPSGLLGALADVVSVQTFDYHAIHTHRFIWRPR